MFASSRYSFHRLGCGACGCLALLIALIVLACVGLFALVRSVRAATPRHAVLLIDNSLSMGYQTVGGTLLEEARNRTIESDEPCL